MHVNELLKKLGLKTEQVNIVVEPEYSLNKLKEFEETYKISSEEAYRNKKMSEEWKQYYIRVKMFQEQKEV